MAKDSQVQTSVAAKVRRRLEDAGRRYFANDNIADMLEPGDIEGLHDEAEAAVVG